MQIKLKYSLIFLSFSLIINAFVFSGYGMRPLVKIRNHPSKSISQGEAKQESQIINLTEPGDYRLIGIDKYVDTGDEDIIKINKDNQIAIGESGEYNIILENVNIDVSNINKASAITVGPYSVANLTLVGENILRSNNGSVIECAMDSNLTITKKSENGFLNLVSNKRGINAEDLVIEAGNIRVRGRECGILGAEIIVNGGNIEASSDVVGLMGGKILINGGNITSLGSKYGIWALCGDLKSDCGRIDIDGGEMNAEGNMIGINAVSITMNHGKMNTLGKDMYGVYAKNIEIFNSKVTAKGYLHGIYAKDMKINGSEIVTSGDIKG